MSKTFIPKAIDDFLVGDTPCGDSVFLTTRVSVSVLAQRIHQVRALRRGVAAKLYIVLPLYNLLIEDLREVDKRSSISKWFGFGVRYPEFVKEVKRFSIDGVVPIGNVLNDFIKAVSSDRLEMLESLTAIGADSVDLTQDSVEYLRNWDRYDKFIACLQDYQDWCVRSSKHCATMLETIKKSEESQKKTYFK